MTPVLPISSRAARGDRTALTYSAAGTTLVPSSTVWIVGEIGAGAPSQHGVIQRQR